MAKKPMTTKDAARIQSATDSKPSSKSAKSDFKVRAQSAADKGKVPKKG